MPVYGSGALLAPSPRGRSRRSFGFGFFGFPPPPFAALCLSLFSKCCLLWGLIISIDCISRSVKPSASLLPSFVLAFSCCCCCCRGCCCVPCASDQSRRAIRRRGSSLRLPVLQIENNRPNSPPCARRKSQWRAAIGPSRCWRTAISHKRDGDIRRSAHGSSMLIKAVPLQGLLHVLKLLLCSHETSQCRPRRDLAKCFMEAGQILT